MKRGNNGKSRKRGEKYRRLHSKGLDYNVIGRRYTPNDECKKKLRFLGRADGIHKAKLIHRDSGQILWLYKCDSEMCQTLFPWHLTQNPRHSKDSWNKELYSFYYGEPFIPVQQKNVRAGGNGDKRMQKLRRKRRSQLQIECWENEGGAILNAPRPDN